MWHFRGAAAAAAVVVVPMVVIVVVVLPPPPVIRGARSVRSLSAMSARANLTDGAAVTASSSLGCNASSSLGCNAEAGWRRGRSARTVEPIPSVVEECVIGRRVESEVASRLHADGADGAGRCLQRRGRRAEVLLGAREVGERREEREPRPRQRRRAGALTHGPAKN